MSINIAKAAHQQGVSLVELMVGLVVGLIILVATGAFYLSTQLTGSAALHSAKLNLQARGAMNTMVDEIRRAGSALIDGQWHIMEANVARTRNPFTMLSSNGSTVSNTTDLNIYDSGICIVFSLDRNWNAVVDDGTGTNPAEYYGFRLQNGTLQMRDGGAGNLSNCTNGTWEDMTDSDFLTIGPIDNTTPVFSVAYQCMNSATNAVSPGNPQPTAAGAQSRCLAGNPVYDAAVSGSTMVDLLENRQVRIAFRGTLVSHTDYQIVQDQTILVRNHRIVNIIHP